MGRSENQTQNPIGNELPAQLTCHVNSLAQELPPLGTTCPSWYHCHCTVDAATIKMSPGLSRLLYVTHSNMKSPQWQRQVGLPPHTQVVSDVLKHRKGIQVMGSRNLTHEGSLEQRLYFSDYVAGCLPDSPCILTFSSIRCLFPLYLKFSTKLACPACSPECLCMWPNTRS